MDVHSVFFYVTSLQADCIECPAGFFCPGLVSADVDQVTGTSTPVPCPKGHYCPAGEPRYIGYNNTFMTNVQPHCIITSPINVTGCVAFDLGEIACLNTAECSAELVLFALLNE